MRALDTLVPCGRGQRLGIFAGSGVGKSSLLGMIARSTTADVNVIALVGERGREVREFIERDLGDALAHSVVVVATSDQPALVRIQAAFTATAIAEHFRDQGHNVMLMMDSVTRFAMAQREVGLAIGEPPATRGYTPSVFALLPRLLERAGTSPRGSITGLYTVLVDGDDMNEPIADAVRSILDGHVVLTRSLAHAGHYPAIDVLQSVSRLIGEIVSPEVRDGRPAAARGAGRLPREGGPDLDRRLPARHRPAARRGDRAAPARSTRSCASAWTSSAPLPDADAALLALAAELDSQRDASPRPRRRRTGAAAAPPASVPVGGVPAARRPRSRRLALRSMTAIAVKFARAAADHPAMSGPSFRFSLERVRVLRERTEDQAKEALAGAMQDQLRSEREARRGRRARRPGPRRPARRPALPIGATI